jgi:hypothetical protein
MVEQSARNRTLERQFVEANSEAGSKRFQMFCEQGRFEHGLLTAGFAVPWRI